MRAAAVLMTFVMAVSVLTSIAIIRRIIMATSVLKASTMLYMHNGSKNYKLICNSSTFDFFVCVSVRSYIGWRGERNISYKNVETSP